MTQGKYAGNTRGKPFAAGNAGKPLGARHKVTRAVEALLEGQHEALTQSAISNWCNENGRQARRAGRKASPPTVDRWHHIVQTSDQTQDEAVDAYGRNRIGPGDGMIVFKPVAPRFDAEGNMIFYEDWPENQRHQFKGPALRLANVCFRLEFRTPLGVGKSAMPEPAGPGR